MTGWFCLALALPVALLVLVAIASGRRRPTGLGWMALFVLLGIAVASGVFVGRQLAPAGVPPTVVPPVVVAPSVLDVPPTARPLSDGELQALVIDLRTAMFPTDQLNLLVRRARTFTFTPTQAARVLLCFTFDEYRLGAGGSGTQDRPQRPAGPGAGHVPRPVRLGGQRPDDPRPAVRSGSG